MLENISLQADIGTTLSGIYFLDNGNNQLPFAQNQIFGTITFSGSGTTGLDVLWEEETGLIFKKHLKIYGAVKMVVTRASALVNGFIGSWISNSYPAFTIPQNGITLGKDLPNDIYSNTLGTYTSTADLSSWTELVPVSSGERNKIMICNFSSKHLFLILQGLTDSTPSGTSSNADSVLSPGETVEFPLTPEVSVWGLHSDPRTTGVRLREIK